jgi:hypothetical protein
MLSIGHFLDDCWELELGQLFTAGAGAELSYSLSDDLGGELTISDGVLQTRFRGERRAAFLLTAEDGTGESAEVYFNLSIPAVTTSTWSVNNMMSSGEFTEDCWRLNLSELFDDPKQSSLRYRLSDDCGGALSLEGGTLHMDLEKSRSAEFSLFAADLFGLEAELPFSLTVPKPTALTGPINEIVKTGLFQEGTWERRLDELFREPKGTALRYELSDDFGGAVKLEDGSLRVQCKGLGTASFTLKATDEYGESAELPITVKEKNMTVIYALWGLGIMGGSSLAAGALHYYRKRYR